MLWESEEEFIENATLIADYHVLFLRITDKNIF